MELKMILYNVAACMRVAFTWGHWLLPSFPGFGVGAHETEDKRCCCSKSPKNRFVPNLMSNSHIERYISRFGIHHSAASHKGRCDKNQFGISLGRERSKEEFEILIAYEEVKMFISCFALLSKEKRDSQCDARANSNGKDATGKHSHFVFTHNRLFFISRSLNDWFASQSFSNSSPESDATLWALERVGQRASARAQGRKSQCTRERIENYFHECDRKSFEAMETEQGWRTEFPR